MDPTSPSSSTTPPSSASPTASVSIDANHNHNRGDSTAPQPPQQQQQQQQHRRVRTITEESLSNPATERIVELNVGGTKYSTSLETLRMDSDSMLCAMFSGRMETTKDSKGRYFLDRDGTLFAYILDYLRNACRLVTLPSDGKTLVRLLREAEYFQLQGLIDHIRASGVVAFDDSDAKSVATKALAVYAEKHNAEREECAKALARIINDSAEEGHRIVTICFQHESVTVRNSRQMAYDLGHSLDKSYFSHATLQKLSTDNRLQWLVLQDLRLKGYSPVCDTVQHSFTVYLDLWESLDSNTSPIQHIHQALERVILQHHYGWAIRTHNVD